MPRFWRLISAVVALALTGGLIAYVSAGAGPAAASVGVLGTGTRTTPTPVPHPTGPNCSRTSIGLTPLTVLKKGRFDGYEGGLYPRGRNVPPKKYLKAGLAAAAQVRPLAPNGSPSRSGRIVLLSVGMSNAYLEFGSFMKLEGKQHVGSGNLVVGGNVTGRPSLELVNGATPRMDAQRIIANEQGYLATLDSDLSTSGVTPDQVQAVWLYEAIGDENQPFPTDAQALRNDLTTIIGLLTSHFPNLRLLYTSSREYAGYAVSTLNPEPYAYDSGFAVKWAIARQIPHARSRPWVAWGPYTWADGTTPRPPSGLTWTCSDFDPDGTHPSAAGALKVANMLKQFFTTNKTTKSWFDG